ncbi:Methyltransferase domain-containing protein [Lachnospiraceae bacterium XBB2008]|nr:Methyltransferase domain-containing protein [Lachnospiraceae bacterium XBB2008]
MEKRDYDKEFQDNTRLYAYDFDYDVMHPFMIRAFSPMFREGNALELGCFQGRFTERLKQHFDDITCVEASAEALQIAKDRVGIGVKFIHGLFEDVTLPQKYDNIFLTHVLEHLDDRVGLLRKINDDWLSDNGVLFLACPNANAPSRQIAVKMGLIEHNSAVTEAERKHGHRITYSLDTLETDAKKAGLKVEYKSGIFFKALANFQWDQVISQKIVSDEYLEGCYQLGQVYPDLCSTIYCVCKKG